MNPIIIDPNPKMHSQKIDAGSAQRLHIKGKERNDHQQPHHVQKRSGHQREQLRRDLSHFPPQHIEKTASDRAEQNAHDG